MASVDSTWHVLALRVENKGDLCEKWHVAVGAAFCGATSQSEEDKLNMIAPKVTLGLEKHEFCPRYSKQSTNGNFL